MGNIRNRLRCLILPFLILPFLAGCWSSRELEDSALLAGVVIEKEGKNYKLTFQVLHPEKLKKGESKAFVLISSSAPSMHEAARRLAKGLKRRLFITQTRALIVEKKLAKEEGIDDILDVLNRDSQFRLNSYLFIADQPVKLLALSSLLDPLAAFGLSTGTQVIHRDLSQMTPNTFIQINKMMMGPTHATYTSLLKKHDETPPAEDHIDIDGTVFFKNGKMVKETTNKELQIGLLLFQNSTHQGSITIFLPEEKKPISIEIHAGKVTIKPRLIGGKLSFDITAKMVGDINEWNPKQKLIASTIKQVEKIFAAEIEKMLRGIYDFAVKKPVTDVLNLGVEVERQLPHYWTKVRDRWDEVLPKAPVHYTVTARIQNVGLIKENNYKIKDEKKPELRLFPFPRPIGR